ncbi:MAG: SoxR reducing system RseC family protein [Wenzhouxiangellaceae bacterium]
MRNSDLIWQTAVVRRDRDGHAWLEFGDPGACSRCSNGTGCGAALFSRLFARPASRLPLTDDDGRPDGRMVQVGLDPRWLVLAAAATYLLPVVAFVTGAVLADLAWPGHDPAALLGGVTLSLAVAVVVRYPIRSISRPRLMLTDFDTALESHARCDQVMGRDD